jgi:hypothetical protein
VVHQDTLGLFADADEDDDAKSEEKAPNDDEVAQPLLLGRS